MKRSAFLFFKGLGLLFAIFCGIGTAVLGWYDGADWMNIVNVFNSSNWINIMGLVSFFS